MTSTDPYTTQLQAGLGLFEETQALLDLWEPHVANADLRQRALDSGAFSNVAARRLRNIVLEAFAPRYLSPTHAAASHLKVLRNALSGPELRQLFFLYTCRANRILADFVRDVYWPRFEGGYTLLSKQDALDFIQRAMDNGKTTKRWSDSTVTRVSNYLLGACADFGLLGMRTKEGRRVQTYSIEWTTVAYLAYELHSRGLGDNSVLMHEDWRLFGLQPEDVRRELKAIALRGLLIFQAAGDAVHIAWQCQSMGEVVNVIAEG